MKELVTALVAAQKSINGIEKDGRNNFHRYSYTTAESMYRECRSVLDDHGLVVIPVGSIVGPGIDGECPATLVRTYMISHVSGEMTTATQHWPIVPEKGRPIDKATAAADTASLGYFLRDLLLLPRVEEGTEIDDDARDKPKDTKPPAPNPMAGILRGALGADDGRAHLKAAQGGKAGKDLAVLRAAEALLAARDEKRKVPAAVLDNAAVKAVLTVDGWQAIANEVRE